MTGAPRRLKDSDGLDPFARELLHAARRTQPMPASNSLRGAHRVARLAAAPVVALGVGLWSKAVAAAFGLGFASALGLVVLTPALRAKLVGPPPSPPVVAPAVKTKGAPVNERSAKSEHALEAEKSSVEALDSGVAAQPSTPHQASSGKKDGLRGEREAESNRTSTDSVLPKLEQPLLSLAELQPDHGAPAELPATSVPPARATMNEEVALLSRARSLVAREPTRALLLLREHAERFPKPTLGAEREVLVIEALARSGRRSEARERAKAFLTTASGELYGPRLKKLFVPSPDMGAR